MKKTRSNQTQRRRLHVAGALLLAGGALTVQANPIITNVVETGGDNEATDTIVAKWTGLTWNTTIANEPILATPVGTPYTVPLFGEDVPCYVDRAHQWNGATAALPLPSYLVGGEYVMAGNDNRDNAAYRLDITVSEPVLVYLLLDNRRQDGSAANPPCGGLEPPDWTVMTWVGRDGWSAMKTGYNRNGDISVPDEVAVDEGGNGTGPGGDVNNYSSVYFKSVEAGTFSVFEYGEGQNMYGVVVKASPNSINNPPVITDLAPANNTLFYSASAGLAFKATTIGPNRIDANKIRLLLNGSDLSAGLAITGNSTNRSVSYTALQADTYYQARIIVTDQAARSTTNDFVFDTFAAATAVMIEGEDYNYGNGQFIDAPTPNAYLGLAGTPRVDYFDQNTTTPNADYRTADYAGLGTAGDVGRAVFTDIGATDYQLTTLETGDWCNYTRTLNGTYHVYLRHAAAFSQPVRLDRVLGDRATTAQTPSPLGIFAAAKGWAATAFTYVPLADAAGAPVAVNFAGAETLRLTALKANVNLQVNYLVLVPAPGAARPPCLSVANPAYNATGVRPDVVLDLFLADGTTRVDASSVSLAFDGADVTGAANVQPVASGGVQVSYDPPGNLAFSRSYAVALAFKDLAGTAFSYQWTFTTVAPVPVIPENFATPVGSGQGDGFALKIRKVPNARTTATAFTLANNALRAERELADQIIDLETDMPFVNEAAGPNSNGIASSTVINFNQVEAATGYFAGDATFPYIDIINTPDPNNIALEATAYLELPAGFHRFGVRSDDGFKLTVGRAFAHTNLVLGIFEGGRGNGLPDGRTEFDFQVLTSGVYAFRLLWYEGNGDANVEFYAVDPVTGKRTLINDRTSASAIKAYPNRSPQIHIPTVAITTPVAGQILPTGPTDVQVKVSASEVNGMIARVELFEGANKLAELTQAPYQFMWKGVYSGRYTLTARATDAEGFNSLSAPLSVVVGTPIVKVNFQNSATVLTPDGYLPDLGDILADRGNGYTYGWDEDNTANARDRMSVNSPDKRYDTFNHFQKTTPARFWEIEIPNARYVVYAACGDPDNYDSVFDIVAETNVTVVKAAATDPVRFCDGQAMVVVGDGRLTLGCGPTAANNKICFVEVYPVLANLPGATLGFATGAGNALTITWTGPSKLQEAAGVTGPWSDVAGNPRGSYSTSSTQTQKFYRAVLE